VISTMDTGARHGHKTSARGFDGFKGPVAIDPDSGVITATAVTAGNTGDAASAGDLLAADLPAADAGAPEVSGDHDRLTDQAGAEPGQCIEPATITASSRAEGVASMEAPLAVYGDAAYGAGALLEELEAVGADIMTKVQPPVAPGGRFPRDRFIIDTGAGTVTCPAHVSVATQPANAGGGMATFGTACAGCPLAAQCTTAATGRRIRIGHFEAELIRARTTQQDAAWRVVTGPPDRRLNARSAI